MGLLSLSLSQSQRGFSLCSTADVKAIFHIERKPIRWTYCPLQNSPITRKSRSLSGQIWFQSVKENRYKALCCQKQEVPVLEGRSMEEIYDTLAQRLLPIVGILKGSMDLNTNYIIGLAGPPGAGKSTLAFEVVSRVNKLWSQKFSTGSDDVASVLPMDGFHLYRSQLDAMEDPEEAHARRGAPWTFAPVLLLNCLRTLRNQASVYAPTFDHGVGDPVENDIFVSPKHKVIIVEGNYLLLDYGIWKDICSVFDEKWFLDIDIDTSMERVLKRHIATGKTPDVAKWRVEYNDRPNAELIMETKKYGDLVIKSVDL